MLSLGFSVVMVITVMLLGILYFRIHVFFVLLITALLFGWVNDISAADLVKIIKEGFGHTMSKIGLLVIFGILLGKSLESTGKLQALAEIFQKKNPLIGVVLVAFLVGLPIFCDSGFVILSAWVLAGVFKDTSKTLALAGGLYGVHCLVPPHPGISAAAETFSLPLGTVFLYGFGLSILPTIWVYFFAKRHQIERNFTHEIQTQEPDYKILIPLFLPIILMTTKTIVALYLPQFQLPVLNFLGEPTFALSVGLLVCIIMYKIKDLDAICTQSFQKAGIILAIIGGGGVLGAVVQKAVENSHLVNDLHMGVQSLIWLGFGLSFLLKLLQGSSTVAVVTAASLLMPVVPAEASLWVLLSMAAGSIGISHANDAYFWVVGQFSETPHQKLLKTYSPMTLGMCLITQLQIWLLSLILL